VLKLKSRTTKLLKKSVEALGDRKNTQSGSKLIPCLMDLPTIVKCKPD
jgi:hypothetical protein